MHKSCRACPPPRLPTQPCPTITGAPTSSQAFCAASSSTRCTSTADTSTPSPSSSSCCCFGASPTAPMRRIPLWVPLVAASTPLARRRLHTVHCAATGSALEAAWCGTGPWGGHTAMGMGGCHRGQGTQAQLCVLRPRAVRAVGRVGCRAVLSCALPRAAPPCTEALARATSVRSRAF